MRLPTAKQVANVAQHDEAAALFTQIQEAYEVGSCTAASGLWPAAVSNRCSADGLWEPALGAAIAVAPAGHGQAIDVSSRADQLHIFVSAGAERPPEA